MEYIREIFGPLLPIVPVENVDEAIKFVNERYFLYILFHCTSLLITLVQRPPSCSLCLHPGRTNQKQR